MSSYNGHRSYEYWNVALWLANDESLYNLITPIARYVDREEVEP